MFTVSSDFVGSFKTGDNINHNLRLLSLLYKYFEKASSDERRLLCKPILLLLISIIEAVLHDFHRRIKFNIVEGVDNLTSEVLDYIRGKKIDELEKYIASAKKHDLFWQNNQFSNFYELLDRLRRIRNRIHIQNVNGDLEPADYNCFTEKRKILAEKALEIILKTMVEKYGRGASKYVKEFELPWDEHYW